MSKWMRLKQAQAIPNLVKWLTIGWTSGMLTGTSSAVFLAALDWATGWRESHPCSYGSYPAADCSAD